MTAIDLCLDGDKCWPDLTELDAAGRLAQGELVAVALLPDALVSKPDGSQYCAPVLTLRITLPDGLSREVVLVQVKLDMLNMIVRAVTGRLAYLASLTARGGTPS